MRTHRASAGQLSSLDQVAVGGVNDLIVDPRDGLDFSSRGSDWARQILQPPQARGRRRPASGAHWAVATRVRTLLRPSPGRPPSGPSVACEITPRGKLHAPNMMKRRSQWKSITGSGEVCPQAFVPVTSRILALATCCSFNHRTMQGRCFRAALDQAGLSLWARSEPRNVARSRCAT